MSSIYKIRGSKDSLLLVRGNYIVNGAYDVELQNDGNTVYFKGGSIEYWADKMCDVPQGIKGGYRDILEWYHNNFKGEVI